MFSQSGELVGVVTSAVPLIITEVLASRDWRKSSDVTNDVDIPRVSTPPADRSTSDKCTVKAKLLFDPDAAGISLPDPKLASFSKVTAKLKVSVSPLMNNDPLVSVIREILGSENKSGKVEKIIQKLVYWQSILLPS